MFGRLFGKKKEEKTEDDVKLEQSLQKTRSGILGRLGSIFQENEITDELWEELEDILISGDVGITATGELVERTRARVGARAHGHEGSPTRSSPSRSRSHNRPRASPRRWGSSR